MMARAPWSRTSPSVKRLMRALVVVPMHIGSYRPSPSLRTLGAVCSSAAPRSDIGGSTPLSKMRIWVASRMPMMCPWMVTVSPARNARTVASSVGKVISWCAMAISLRFPVVVDGAVSEDVGAGAAGGPALVVDGHRVQRDVGVGLLDVHRQHGGVAAQP